jgi:hypothetical protein
VNLDGARKPRPAVEREEEVMVATANGEHSEECGCGEAEGESGQRDGTDRGKRSRSEDTAPRKEVILFILKVAQAIDS